MKNRLAALVFAVFGLCHCSNCPDPDSAQATAENLLSDAAYAFANATVAPFAGPRPGRAGTSEDCRCTSTWGAAPPAEGTAALWSPPRACPATAADGPCPACVAAHCCAETVACLAEDTCPCLMARQMPGLPRPESAQCGAQDAAYAAESACLTTHCAEECLQ
jgi:hypothetical protein